MKIKQLLALILVIQSLAFGAEVPLWQTSGATKIKPAPSKIITTDKQIESTLVTGTAPFSVTSTTAVSNLSIGGNAATASVAPAGALSGTTLNAAVVNSSLTTVGVLTGLTVTSSLEVIRSDGSNQADITATTYGVNGGGILHGRMANGTIESPTGVLSGDIFAGVGGRAYHSGGAFQSSSPTSIHWVASEDQTVSAYGSYLRILTTPKLSTTRQERVIVSDSGTLWAHDTSTFDPRVALQTKPVSDVAVLASGSVAGGTGISVGAFGYGDPFTAGFRAGVAGGTPASPTASPNDQLLAFMGGHGFDGTTWSAGTKALLGFYASELWSSTAQGTYITLATTPTSSTTRAERMRIIANGNVGIGTTAPNEKLEVASATGGRFIMSDAGGASRKVILFQAPGTNAYGTIFAYDYGGATGLNLAINAAGGNVGIGTPTMTAAKLVVLSTTAQQAWQYNASNQLLLTVGSTGAATFSATGSSGSITIGDSGDKFSVYGVAAVVRPGAITQTYATTSATHAAVTTAAMTSFGVSANAVLVDVTTAAVADPIKVNANFDDVADQINKLQTDLANVKGVLNLVLDGLQSQGLAQ